MLTNMPHFELSVSTTTQQSDYGSSGLSSDALVVSLFMHMQL